MISGDRIGSKRMYTLAKLFLAGRTRMEIRLIVSVLSTGHTSVRPVKVQPPELTNGIGPKRVLNFIMHEEEL